jgi:hypothetical protein
MQGEDPLILMCREHRLANAAEDCHFIAAEGWAAD